MCENVEGISRFVFDDRQTMDFVFDQRFQSFVQAAKVKIEHNCGGARGGGRSGGGGARRLHRR